MYDMNYLFNNLKNIKQLLFKSKVSRVTINYTRQQNNRQIQIKWFNNYLQQKYYKKKDHCQIITHSFIYSYFIINKMEENNFSIPNSTPPSFINYFAPFDTFYQSPSFYFQNQKRFKTICGSFLSIIILVLVLTFLVKFSNHKQNINLVQMVQQTSGFYYSLNANQYPLGLSFYNMKQQRISVYNNFSVQFICRHINANQIVIDKKIGTKRNCGQFGEFCIGSNTECSFYQLSNKEVSYVIIQISICDSITDHCNLTLLQNNYSQFYVSINYENYEPNFDQPFWKKKFIKNMIQQQLSFSLTTNLLFTKEKFVTNYKIFGSFDLFSKNLYGIKQRQIDVAQQKLKPITLQYRTLLITFNIYPNHMIQIFHQNFWNITEIIVTFVCIYSLLREIGKFLISKYIKNLKCISLGKYFKYSIDENKKLINFEQYNCKTFLFCLTYFPLFQNFYPQCYKTYFYFHLDVYKTGQQKLKLNVFFNDIMNAYRQQEDFRPDELLNQNKFIAVQKLQNSEFNKKIQEYFQTKQKQFSKKQFQIFIKWCQLNQFNFQEIKQTSQIILFQSPSKINNNQNILRSYNQFKQSMGEQDKQEKNMCMDTNVGFSKLLKQIQQDQNIIERNKNIQPKVLQMKDTNISNKNQNSKIMQKKVKFFNQPEKNNKQ